MRSTSRYGFGSIVVVLALCLLAPSRPTAAAWADHGAGNGFSVRDLRGRYVISQSGFAFIGRPDDPQPTAIVGQFTADGAGNIVGSRTLNLGGLFTQTDDFTCTYTVEPSGQGVASCHGGPAGRQDLTFVIVDKNEIRTLSCTTAGCVPGGTPLSPRSVASGSARRK